MAILNGGCSGTARIIAIVLGIACAVAAAGVRAEPSPASPPETAAVDFSGTPPLPPPPSGASALPPVSAENAATASADGRPPAPPTAREGLAWIPRIVLMPAHLTTEYVLRRPIVAFVRWGDEHFLWKRIYDTFTWNGGRAGIYPIGNIDLGLNETLGAAFFWHGFGVADNTVNASASGGSDVILASARDRFKLFRDRSGVLIVHGEYTQRPDGLFYGLGPDTRTEDETGFSYAVTGAGAGIDGSLGGFSHALVEVDYRRARFDGSHTSVPAPQTDERFGGPGQLPLPPGFAGYQIVEPVVLLVLDSRNPRPEWGSGTGVRFEGRGAYGIDPGDTGTRFALAGGRAAAFYDFTGAHHVLALDVAANLAQKLGPNEIPFWELPTLGGNDWMRGFLNGRLRGPSTVTAALEYRYPCWTFLDAELFTEVGNAFAGHFDGFAPERLFLSYGFALRSNIAPQTPVGITVAFASNRFDDPAFRLLDVTRFTVGVSHAY
jgi:hypothetical protein